MNNFELYINTFELTLFKILSYKVYSRIIKYFWLKVESIV